MKSDETLTSVFDRILRGSMPQMIVDESLTGEAFFGEYMQTYLERDNNGNEIDLLIEDNNILYPVEIKKSAEPGKEAIKNFSVLKDLNRTIGKGSVLCLSSFSVPIDENNIILPVSAI